MTDLFTLIDSNELAEIGRMAQANGSNNEKRADGLTPLIYAASLGMKHAVEILLANGADPNAETNEGYTALDFARGRNDGDVEELLWNAIYANEKDDVDDQVIRSYIIKDMRHFLRAMDLKMPPRPYAAFLARIEDQVGSEASKNIEHYLETTKYEILLEQLFAHETFTTARFSRDFSTVRSPMALGAYDAESMNRRGVDPLIALAAIYETSRVLLDQLLPADIFHEPPKAICEIGGAWGATIKYLNDRFNPDQYYNFEPDAFYSQFTQEKFGATAMDVDGETLNGVPDDHVDLVIANNVLIFVPVLKLLSYLREMRRVVKPGGVIVFNAALSSQIDETMIDHYLETYFPIRTLTILPWDLVEKIFPAKEFKIREVYDKEYVIIHRLN